MKILKNHFRHFLVRITLISRSSLFGNKMRGSPRALLGYLHLSPKLRSVLGGCSVAMVT